MREYQVTRKLQEQSGSYFVILPKLWVESRGLKQGDVMSVSDEKWTHLFIHNLGKTDTHECEASKHFSSNSRNNVYYVTLTYIVSTNGVHLP